MTEALIDVIDDLAELVGRIDPAQGGAATPCPEYDLAALRRHVLAWLPVFATGLSDPDGTQPRPDPEAYQAPSDPSQAAAQIRQSGARIAKALADGVADRPVLLQGTKPLPGSMVINMLTAEVIAHGWDVARSTGLTWNPPAAASRTALDGLRAMLSPEYRGEGKPFGVEVAAPQGAEPLEQLLAFSGRDPDWTPPAS
jgi:uncharacterized protein (TIGR03086 family)